MLVVMRRWWAVVLLLLAFGRVRAHASATLLLGEPYSYDGAFAGTGHAAVYLSRVCAESPLKLRRCTSGEQGVVLSRYHGVGGYDWIAVPLIPYLYAVDRTDEIPLYADAGLEAFLRDRYRRRYLATMVADGEHGESPDGPWVQLVGSAYDRTIYAFQIETREEKDDELIKLFNARRNVGRYKLLSANCADFVREAINFYYPGALHRNVIADLGVTTPKQIAKCLVRYSRHHGELHFTRFLIPQVPGSIKRSKPVKGVVESAFKSKKYMVPLLFWHPAIVGCFAAAYFTGSGGFDPGRNALVLDANLDLQPSMSTQQRRDDLSRLESLNRELAADAHPQSDHWSRLEATAQPTVDRAGRPAWRIRVRDAQVEVGLVRSNIVNESESSSMARQLLVARLREELRKNSVKTAESIVDNDLSLLEQLGKLEEKERASRGSDEGEIETASRLR
jgi:hypothetical protein